MTSPSRHHHHHHHYQAQQQQQLGRLHQLYSDMNSSTSTDVARWFGDDEYRCQPVHRHGNGYTPFFQHPHPRRPDAVVSGHPWSSHINNTAVAASWSRHASETPPWTPAGSGRPGYRGLEAWPAVSDNIVSPIFSNHDAQRQQPPEQQQQQQCSVSPDDVTTSLQVHKYPWMSIIGKFNSSS